MNARRSLLWTLTVVLAAGLLASGCGGGGVGGRDISVEGPVTVVRQFEQGEVLKYKFKAETSSGIKRTAYEQSISTQAELKTTNTITEITDDTVTMTMRFDSAAGGITVGDNMQPDETISALRGKELVFELDSTGRVLGWSGLSGEEALEAGAGQMAMLLYDVFPDLPDEPLSIGTTWEVDYEIPDITSAVERDFVGETVYTVVGFKEKYEIPCVEIERVTDFEFEGRAEQAGEMWLMSGTGKITGAIILALEDGKTVYSTSEATLTLTGEGASVAGAAASGVVEMGIQARLKIELL